MHLMRLSLKISLATVLAISVVLLASGYYSVHRETRLLQADVMADHRTLGRAIAVATSAAAAHNDPERAKAILDESARASIRSTCASSPIRLHPRRVRGRRARSCSAISTTPRAGTI